MKKGTDSFRGFELTEDDARLLPLLVPAHREILAITGNYSDIAAALNIARGTAKSRRHRARTALTKLRETKA